MAFTLPKPQVITDKTELDEFRTELAPLFPDVREDSVEAHAMLLMWRAGRAIALRRERRILAAFLGE